MPTYEEIMKRLVEPPSRLVEFVRREVPGDVEEGLGQLGRFYQVVARAVEWSVTGSYGFRHFVAVSEAVDPYWHTHVLYTRHYREFCAWLVPRPAGLPPGGDARFFLDHYPLAVETAPNDKVRQAYERTRARVRDLVGDGSAVLDDWWPESGDTVRAYACVGRGLF